MTGSAVSEAAVVVDSPLIAPDVSPSSLVTQSPGTGAVKSKTEAETGKKGGVAAGVPNVPCPHCDKKFMRGYNMRVHIERVHNKSKPWQCQFCEKTFATTSDLKQHLSSHGMGKIHKVTKNHTSTIRTKQCLSARIVVESSQIGTRRFFTESSTTMRGPTGARTVARASSRPRVFR